MIILARAVLTARRQKRFSPAFPAANLTPERMI
jgi:hypothetical protein